MSRTAFLPSRRHMRGLSLVELMVALVLGLVLTFALVSVYMSSKTAFVRQQQLSSVQQSVRMAFEYLASDLRMVGHYGCYTGNNAPPGQAGVTADLAGDFSIGVAGYEFINSTAGAYTISSNTPADTNDVTKWASNNGPSYGSLPDPTGITPGSDVLVVRSVTGAPLRLRTATTGSATFSVERNTGGKCGNGSSKLSGFCSGSYGLIANCTKARVFQTTAVADANPQVDVTIAGGNFIMGEYQPSNTEVFPLQTVVYYVKASSSGKGTSLYRRIYDGTVAAGVEQELIEGVENMQVMYGRDNLPAGAPDGAVDDYVTANNVASADEWRHVVAVRVSLLIRASEPVTSDVAVPSSGVVNDVTVTYPTSGSKYDRRVFTTTVAVRNRIAYF